MATISARNHHRNRPSSPVHNNNNNNNIIKHRKLQYPFLPALLTLFLFVGIFCHRDFVEEAETAQKKQQQQPQPQSNMIRLEPKQLLIDNVEIFLQKPSTTSDHQGVVLLFHGCGHDGIDWFELPEEQKIVRYLLEQNFVTISISSKDRTKSRCWDGHFPASENQDVQRVQSVLPKVFEEHVGDTNPPLYAIGASSGGMFSSILRQVYPFLGISLIVAPGNSAAWAWLSSSNSESGQDDQQPTTAITFVYMPKDATFAGPIQIMSAEEQLKGKFPTKSFSCKPKPVEATRIHKDIPSISLEKAQSIVDALTKAPLSVVDKETHEVTKDPRHHWKNIAKVALTDLTDREIAAVEEHLNTAWGAHEMTVEHLPAVVEFWKQHQK